MLVGGRVTPSFFPTHYGFKSHMVGHGHGATVAKVASAGGVGPTAYDMFCSHLGQKELRRGQFCRARKRRTLGVYPVPNHTDLKRRYLQKRVTTWI